MGFFNFQPVFDVFLLSIFTFSLYLAYSWRAKAPDRTRPRSRLDYTSLVLILLLSCISQVLLYHPGLDTVWLYNFASELPKVGPYIYSQYSADLKYGPIYPVILATEAALFPEAAATALKPFPGSVPWLTMLRAPAILANLALGLFVFRILRGGRTGLLGASLVLLNPFYYFYSIFDQGVYPIMLSFLAAALCMLQEKRLLVSGALLGISLMTIQTGILAALLVLIRVYRGFGMRGLAKWIGSASIVILVVSFPFLLYDRAAYLSSMLLDIVGTSVRGGFSPTYDYGHFAGVWSVLGFLNTNLALDVLWAYYFRIPVSLLIVSVSIYACFKGTNSNNYSWAALLGFIPLYLVFTNAATVHGLSPWHLVAGVPFTVLVALTMPTLRIQGLFTLSSLQVWWLSYILESLMVSMNPIYAPIKRLLPDFLGSPPYVVGDLMVFLSYLLLFVGILKVEVTRTSDAAGRASSGPASQWTRNPKV